MKSSWTQLITPLTFSRSGWSVVRSASLAKGGTSKKRQSRHLHEVFKRPSLLRHPKKDSFKTILIQTLTTVRGMRSRRYYVTPTTTTWDNSHSLPLHNSGTLAPVHELFRRPSYVTSLSECKRCGKL
jgi:hypothetical protein